jgi:hypothetical protein
MNLEQEELNNLKEEEEKFEPPTKHGLSNSEPIIPSYYFKKMRGLLFNKEMEILYTDINYLTIIKDDIRNFRKLNKYQIDYIKHSDHVIKNEIIDELIKSINYSTEIINNT